MSGKAPPEFKLPFGMRGGLLVHVSEVEQGLACRCVCPGCQQPLIARKGKVTSHHFAHHRGTPCEAGLETALHLAAKHILIELRKIALPPVSISFDSYRPPMEIAPNGTYRIDEVREERRLGEIVPDLLVFCGGIPLLVEIRVTHAVDDTKLEKIRSLGISAVEVNLSYSSRLLSMAALTDAIVHDPTTKSWLFNAKAEQYKLALLETCERKPIIERRMALHVDHCPTNVRSWKGKSYANVIDDCAHCRYAFAVNTETRVVMCGGRHKIESIKAIKKFRAARDGDSESR